MQHIVNLAFDFDDQKATEAANRAVENELERIIKEIVTEKIAPKKMDYITRRVEPDWTNFYRMEDKVIKEFIETHKEQIIDRAADKIRESVSRSRAWKERFKEEMEKMEGAEE